MFFLRSLLCLDLAGAGKDPKGGGSDLFFIHILSRKFKKLYAQKSENCYQNQISKEISGAMIIVENQRMTVNINLNLKV